MHTQLSDCLACCVSLTRSVPHHRQTNINDCPSYLLFENVLLGYALNLGGMYQLISFQLTGAFTSRFRHLRRVTKP